MYALHSTTGTPIKGQGKGSKEFGPAREQAEALALAEGIEVQVIHSETKAVAFVTSPKAQAKAQSGERFAPYTRIETPKHPAPEYAGYVTAYTRSRIGATAYREVKEDGTRGGWRIHDGRTNGFVDVPNTKSGAKVFTEMRLGRML